MGDPFWRRFGTATEPERTLASENVGLGIRLPSSGDEEGAGKSRNDLFSTDWKWKGSGEVPEQERDSSRGFPERNTFALSSSARSHQDTESSGNVQESTYLAQSTTDSLRVRSRDASSSSLGAPIRLESSTRALSANRHPSPSPLETRRSRNDTIYNVNHLTVTPPRASSAEDVFRAVSLLPDEHHNQQTTSMRKTATHQSPLSLHHTATAASESSSSSSSADSAITSFTADQPGPPAHVMSPITPITPGVSRFQSTFSPKMADTEFAIRHTAERILTSDTGVPTPQIAVSLSRTSSLTIAHSPSAAIANVTRKAGLLLLDDEPNDAASPNDESSDEGSARLRTDITSRQWLLGYGRYAKVFLGSYRTTTTGWQLCAAKVFDADAESVEMARKEASILQYLQENEPTTSADEAVLDGRGFILECCALVNETAVEPPPAASLDELSRQGSVAGPPTQNNSRRTSATALQRIATEGCSPAGNVRAVHTTSTNSRASETSAMLRQLRHGSLKVPVDEPIHRPILLVPFYANGSMATFLKTHEDGIDAGLWSTWFQQGLAALAWCKGKGVLHNDIKPANFLLDDDLNLKLGDFGSALRIDDRHPPNDGIGLGTVPYASPEIVDPSPDRTFSFPSDIFSFGVTMRQCQTGREPYEGLRAVEMMYHVRKGKYWEHQARQLIAHGPLSPVARLQADGVRRAESLRQPVRKRLHRPSLARTPSSDIILRRSDEIPEPPVAAQGPVLGDEHIHATQDLEQAREGWLKRMVDPDPATRPTPEELLASVATCDG